MRTCFCWAVLLLNSAMAFATMTDTAAYEAEILKFRETRETNLKRDDSWLTVSGLFWVRPGETRLGSDPSNDILLPPGTPPFVGVLSISNEAKASFQPETGVEVKRKEEPFPGGAIRSDADGGPDVLAVGDLRLILIKRGARLAIRLKDNNSMVRRNFSGLQWFPISEAWRFRAKFIPNTDGKPKTIVFDTIIGEQESRESPGEVEFEVGGKTLRMIAVKEGESLWFVFRDATSGRTTHGGARQLYAPLPKDGVVDLDFNKATNLPCAYTPYATCPLAPPRNRLPVAVKAGEMKYDAKP